MKRKYTKIIILFFISVILIIAGMLFGKLFIAVEGKYLNFRIPFNRFNWWLKEDTYDD